MNGLKRIWILMVACCMLAVGVNAQQPATEVGQCLQAGNASCLSSHMSNTVTLSVDGERSTYSRAQAEMVLKDFFRKHQAKSFKLSPSSAGHVTGMLITDKGNYRVFVSIAKSKSGYLVQEIRLEE